MWSSGALWRNQGHQRHHRPSVAPRKAKHGLGVAVPGATRLSLVTVSLQYLPSFSAKSIKNIRKGILLRLQSGRQQVTEKHLNTSEGKRLRPQGHYLMALHLHATLGRPVQDNSRPRGCRFLHIIHAVLVQLLEACH